MVRIRPFNRRRLSDSTEYGFVLKQYFENGQLSDLSYNNAGKQPYQSFYQNGKKKEEGQIFNIYFLKLSKWEYWYENGLKSSEEYYNENIPNLRNGEWKWWDENGKLIKVEIYKEG
jgi:antitoxin component YwqK of YwqJK toxin-antitoxin module